MVLHRNIQIVVFKDVGCCINRKTVNFTTSMKTAKGMTIKESSTYDQATNRLVQRSQNLQSVLTRLNKFPGRVHLAPCHAYMNAGRMSQSVSVSYRK